MSACVCGVLKLNCFLRKTKTISPASGKKKIKKGVSRKMNITNRQMQKFLLLCVSIYNAEVLGLTVQGGGWSAL